MHQNNQFGLIDDFSHSTNLGWYNGACTEGLNQATLTPKKKLSKNMIYWNSLEFFL